MRHLDVCMLAAWGCFLYAPFSADPPTWARAAIFNLGMARWFRIGNIQRRIEMDYEDGED